MNSIMIPANVDQESYYGIFSSSVEGKYKQCSTNYEHLTHAIEFWRHLIKKHPDQTFRIYQVLVSQIYIPAES